MSDLETTLRTALRRVTEGQRLDPDQTQAVVEGLTDPALEQPALMALAAGLLCALRTRGEAPEEIVGAVRALRSRQRSLPSLQQPPDRPLIDTCGTGGDGAHLINLSTLAALVVASLGLPVAKHGNRSVSSACGSADLLEALGYRFSEQPEEAAQRLSSEGFAFLFAPHFHPALRHLATLRRALGLRTLFNIIGPLVNPAALTHQLIGVYSSDLVPLLAHASSALGLQGALIVHGEGGLDELSPFGATQVALSRGQEVETWTWRPSDFGAQPVSLHDLQGGGPERNAHLAREVMAGRAAPMASAVAMNAAAALWLAQQESDLKTAYQRSYDALRSGQVGLFFEGLRRSEPPADPACGSTPTG